MPRSSSYSNEDRIPLCPKCGGTGHVLDPRNPENTILCPKCGGSGRKLQGNTSTPSAGKKRKANKKAEKKKAKKELKARKAKFF